MWLILWLLCEISTWKSNTGLEHGYNAKLERYMGDNFNFKQILKEDTSVYHSVLDLFYKWKHSIFYYLQLLGQIIKIVAAALDLKVGDLLIK